jgi:uncharacterized protein YjbI with pentapeptide repeats
MADRQHLEILAQGVATWNQWRSENPSIRPDLSGEVLAGMDLSHIDLGPICVNEHDVRLMDLQGANLTSSDFRDCKLTGAKLRKADLSHANLGDADLAGADLSFAKLVLTILQGCNLGGADLLRAELFGAWAKRANFREASLYEANAMGMLADSANFSGADLYKAGLSNASLCEADFSRAKLSGALLNGARAEGCNFSQADLAGVSAHRGVFSKSDFSRAHLCGGSLSDSDLREALFEGTDVRGATFEGANLSGVIFTSAITGGGRPIGLRRANLSNANFRGADLRGTDLMYATLVGTDLADAQLSGCRVYGTSVWDIRGRPANQSDLIVSSYGQTPTVDDLQVAQFINLLIDHRRIRDVINTVGDKGILILGRFTERKNTLVAIRDALRARGFLPIVFDFERPEQRDFSETVLTLAGMSRFIIADITRPKSVPLELELTVPNYMIPFVPIIQDPDEPFAMFKDLWKKHRDWVLEPLRYSTDSQLIKVFDKAILEPANDRRELLRAKKAEEPVIRNASDYE